MRFWCGFRCAEGGSTRRVAYGMGLGGEHPMRGTARKGERLRLGGRVSVNPNDAGETP